MDSSFLFNNSFPSDLKAPVCQYSLHNSFYKLSPGSLNSQLQAGTPHGISDILSRSMVGGQGTPALLTGYPPHMGGFGGTVTSPGLYYNRDFAPSGLGGFAKTSVESCLKGKSNGYWADGGYEWRRQPSANNAVHTDTSGKKKHTRPTFSGHQIFALEKTFEQTKYLAGPERARLAYSLGMTESQVKVWFQNRRTKWRKKSASEPSSTQSSQQESGDATDNEVEDEEYNKPLDPDTDDEKIRQLLRKHRRAFSVLRLV